MLYFKYNEKYIKCDYTTEETKGGYRKGKETEGHSLK